MEEPNAFASFVVGFCGVAYFLAWSYSFYPQLILNFQRKRTDGLSPDFVWVNPLGFLALTLWNWGAALSPVARREYQERHHGHLPQVSTSDLAFCLHALIISTITIGQVLWYGRLRSQVTRPTEGERSPLITDGPSTRTPTSDARHDDHSPPHSSIKPSLVAQAAMLFFVLSSFVYGCFIWGGKAQFLDWLYYMGDIKLVISAVKYVPQVVLNHRLRAVKGFAIGVVICDLIGSTLSFTQLVVSSVFIAHDPSGIIANPAKLGLAGLSLIFDIIFIVQKYWLYRRKTDDEETTVA